MVETAPLNIRGSKLLIDINPSKVLIPKLLNSLCFKCVYGGPIFDYIVGLPGNVIVQYVESDNGLIAGVYRINGKIVDFRGCNRVSGSTPVGEGLTWIINEDYKFTVQKSKDLWHIIYHNTPHWISDRVNNIPILPTESDNLTRLQIETLYLPHQYRNHKPAPKPHYNGLEDILDELYSLLGGHGIEIHCHPDDFFGWTWTRPKGNPEEALNPSKRPQPTRCWAHANSGLEPGEVLVKDIGRSSKPRATQKIANLLISDFNKFNLAGVATLQERIRPKFLSSEEITKLIVKIFENTGEKPILIGVNPLVFFENTKLILMDYPVFPVPSIPQGIVTILYREALIDIGAPGDDRVDLHIGDKNIKKKLEVLVNKRGLSTSNSLISTMESLRDIYGLSKGIQDSFPRVTQGKINKIRDRQCKYSVLPDDLVDTKEVAQDNIDRKIPLHWEDSIAPDHWDTKMDNNENKND